jgi:hypothetical protein
MQRNFQYRINLLWRCCLAKLNSLYILALVTEVRARSPTAFLNDYMRILLAAFVPMPPVWLRTLNVLLHSNRLNNTIVKRNISNFACFKKILGIAGCR